MRALIAFAMFAIIAAFPKFPKFVVPGLLLLLVLVFVQSRLWKELSKTAVVEARADRRNS